MDVPQTVRAAALAAFDERRPDVEVLELVNDSATGGWQRPYPLPDKVTRVLVFAGPDLMVRVSVRAAAKQQADPALVTLEVRTEPTLGVRIDVLSPRTGRPSTDMALSWGPEARGLVSAPSRGPLSLLLEASAHPGLPRRWRTAWVTL